MPVKTHDLKHVPVILGSFTIGGYGEDGGVSIEPNSDVGEFSVGADGEVTVSRTNDKSMIVTITVRETSRGYRVLGELLTAQEAEVKITGLAFLMIDEISGERVKDDSAVFIGRPTIAKNKLVGDREFRLVLPQGADNIQYAPSNLT